MAESWRLSLPLVSFHSIPSHPISSHLAEFSLVSQLIRAPTMSNLFLLFLADERPKRGHTHTQRERYTQSRKQGFSISQSLSNPELEGSKARNHFVAASLLFDLSIYPAARANFSLPPYSLLLDSNANFAPFTERERELAAWP